MLLALISCTLLTKNQPQTAQLEEGEELSGGSASIDHSGSMAFSMAIRGLFYVVTVTLTILYF